MSNQTKLYTPQELERRVTDYLRLKDEYAIYEIERDKAYERAIKAGNYTEEERGDKKVYRVDQSLLPSEPCGYMYLDHERQALEFPGHDIEDADNYYRTERPSGWESKVKALAELKYRIDCHNQGMPRPQEAKNQLGFTPIRTHGISWSQAELCFINSGNDVRIEYNGRVTTRSFEDAGFADGRKKKEPGPNEAWNTLVAIAKQPESERYYIAAHGTDFSLENDKLKNVIRAIRKGMRGLFPDIHTEAISNHRQGQTQEGHYKINFRLDHQTDDYLPSQEEQVDWLDIMGAESVVTLDDE